MKQRITYLLRDPANFSPAQLEVHEESLDVQALDAAKEHRFTFSFSELPQEIWRVLKQFQDVHIRWQSPRPYESIAPFVSRVPPGLHMFVKPQRKSDTEQLCPLLKKLFDDDLTCKSLEETFISLQPTPDNSESGSILQYHQLLPSLKDLATYLEAKICAASDRSCEDFASSLLNADYVDIDYDAASHSLIANVFWSKPPSQPTWTETITLDGRSEKVEVGVLNNEKPDSPSELKLGGLLTVLGQNKKPSAALFSFPSRHHPSTDSTYTTSFLSPTGLHPTLALTFPASPLSPPSPDCKLHTYLTLPSPFFLDRYQFTDPLTLQSHHLTALHHLAGATDLEAPDWVVHPWGSAALLEIALPPSPNNPPNRNHTVTIPLHLRYLPPTPANSTTPSHRAASLPWPAVFWRCSKTAAERADEDFPAFDTNPFDRRALGYDALFEDNEEVRFLHWTPAPATASADKDGRGLVESVGVPVVDMRTAAWVEWGTVVVVVVGACWVGWKVLGVLMRGRERRGDRKKEE